jgi:hypothetical protein
MVFNSETGSIYWFDGAYRSRDQALRWLDALKTAGLDILVVMSAREKIVFNAPRPANVISVDGAIDMTLVTASISAAVRH